LRKVASASARPNPEETPVMRNVFAMAAAFPKAEIAKMKCRQTSAAE
jgi:hypothetical protein